MKNPWPIALIVLISTAFVSAVTVAVVMIRQPVDLVVRDYYEQDLRHAERMAEEQRALALDPPLRLHADPAARTLAAHFPDPSATGTLHLYRPSDSSLDQVIDLALDDQGHQLFDLADLQSGLWRINVQWEQNGEGYYQTEQLVLP
ncbi:MAG TPA: FixH family protein [Kiritimatiellia bacterium]|nr:FixH family protein [Kiritimatiellia bacterium]